MNHQDNNGKHMHRVIATTTCAPHKADVGMACYSLPSIKSGQYHYGVCNKRIRKAGFIGKISPQSMRAKAPLKKDGVKPFKKKPNTRPANYNSK